MEGKYSPGKPARKFYLSEEAAAMLFAESKRSTYPMSTLVDMAIKRCYGPQPAPVFPPTPQEVFAEQLARLEEMQLEVLQASLPPVRSSKNRGPPPKKDDPFDF